MENKKRKRNPLNLPDEYYNSLETRAKLQLPFIAYGDMFFFCAFCMLGSFLTFQGLMSWPAVLPLAFLCLATSFVFLVSFILIKKQKLIAGATVASCGILFAVMLILDVCPPSENPLVYYRGSAFVAVMAICNQVVTLRKRQIYIFSAVTAVFWVISCIINASKTMHDVVGTISAIAINSLACTLACVILGLLNRFNRTIVEKAIKSEDEAKDNLSAITNVLGESKNGLEVGKKLYEETQKASANIEELNKIYLGLSNDAIGLTGESFTISASSNEVKNQAEQMKISVENQNNSINQTSDALDSIAGNLSNLSGIAEQRSTNMKEMLNTLDSEKKLIRTIVEQVQLVEESSKGIAGFVSTVDSIAEQTGLLAMNASIEAAHAGVMGKGFSVIAQEIRKLSEQTSKNAEQISQELTKNAEVVLSTTKSVGSFDKYIQKTTQEMRSTIEMIEQLITGIQEIDSETRKMMESIKYVVSQSKETGLIVDNVVSEIANQDAALGNMTKFAEELSDRVNGMNKQISEISSAIEIIEKGSLDNMEVTKKINEALI